MTKQVGVVLAIITIGALGWMAFKSLEYYEEEVDAGWSVEANQNPFLALELFSEQQSISVFSTDKFQEIQNLSQYDVVYVTDSSLVLSDQRLESVLNWLERGGHLIVSTTFETDESTDRLLSYFDFTPEDSFYSYAYDEEISEEGEVVENSEEQSLADDFKAYNASLQQQSELDSIEQTLESSDRKIALKELQVRENWYSEDEITELSFNGIDGNLRIAFENHTYIDHPAFYDEDWQSEKYYVDYWRSSSYGVQFAQASYESGLITVMAGNEIWQNDHIDLFDHAYLWLILSGDDKTAILFGSNMPSLFSLMYQNLPETIYSAFVLLIAWLWWQMKRFGPVRELDIQTRRSFLEHISASSSFYWRRNQYSKLIKPLINQITTMSEARISKFAQASEEERLSLLAEQSGLSITQIHQAFTSDPRLNQDTFIAKVQILQRIRESL